MVTGKCECGQVSFEIEKVSETASACHCSQCRRTSGHIWASTNAEVKDLRFTNEAGLSWYKSSDYASRGFCKNCGASLFYKLDRKPELISIAVGCLDHPVNVKLHRHIFVADKADYYEIGDGLDQLETS
jgi:hypothetical protein